MPRPRAGYTWYARSRKAIKAVYKDDWCLWAAIASAVSANSSVKATVKLANKAYNELVYLGCFRRESFVKTHYLSLLGVLENGMPNGRKCRALYHNLVGVETEVPIDIWMMRYYFGHSKVPNTKQFDEVEWIIRRDAKMFRMTPAQRQAQIWCRIRGKSDDFSDYLMQGKLL
jgi:hypothetical protein